MRHEAIVAGLLVVGGLDLAWIDLRLLPAVMASADAGELLARGVGDAEERAAVDGEDPGPSVGGADREASAGAAGRDRSILAEDGDRDARTGAVALRESAAAHLRPADRSDEAGRAGLAGKAGPASAEASDPPTSGRGPNRPGASAPSKENTASPHGARSATTDEASDAEAWEKRIGFPATGSATLHHRAREAIRAFVRSLPLHRSLRVVVRGHTDARGDPEINRDLSRRRAQAVADALVRHGIDPANITVEGLGSTEPAVPGSTRQAMRRNRRVEILVEEAE